MSDWKVKLETEFERAEAARANGNEGQARVCARRAAGIAIREYYARRGQSVHTPSAYDLLQLSPTPPRGWSFESSSQFSCFIKQISIRVFQSINLLFDAS